MRRKPDGAKLRQGRKKDKWTEQREAREQQEGGMAGDLCTRCGFSRAEHVGVLGYFDGLRVTPSLCPTTMFSAEAEPVVETFKRVTAARKAAGADDDEELAKLTELALSEVLPPPPELRVRKQHQFGEPKAYVEGALEVLNKLSFDEGTERRHKLKEAQHALHELRRLL